MAAAIVFQFEIALFYPSPMAVASRTMGHDMVLVSKAVSSINLQRCKPEPVALVRDAHHLRGPWGSRMENDRAGVFHNLQWKGCKAPPMFHLELISLINEGV